MSRRKSAVIAGSAILAMSVLAGYAYGFVFDRLVIPGEASATVRHIKASGLLFRSGILAWTMILVCDVLAAWALYYFLKQVSEGLSLLMAWFRLVYAVMLGGAILNLDAIPVLLNNTMTVTQDTEAQVMLFIQLFQRSWSAALILFGLHLLILGFLAFRSGYIPVIWSVLLTIAGLSYLGVHTAKLLFSQYEVPIESIETVLSVPMAAGEMGLGIWLLIRGRIAL
ncbi:DUF4386 domain-containing protein [Compostibacter hankyongensis]|uniref:DUF4386 domain-containing protein n=2 Tax=Compostibacter hankyongensis TaxID=1007089 RepID=A0ABP8G6D4_9BACT